jgi:DNA-binding MarR family transcriptional regulator
MVSDMLFLLEQFEYGLSRSERYAVKVSVRSDPRQSAWRALVETHGVLFDRLATEMKAEFGTPVTWYDVLLHLDDVEGQRRRMGDLAEAVVVSKSGLTTLVDRMEAAGLVRREIPPGDRRSIDVVMTDEGRRRFAQLRAFHRAGIERHFCAHLSEDDAEHLIEILGRLQAASAA